MPRGTPPSHAALGQAISGQCPGHSHVMTPSVGPMRCQAGQHQRVELLRVEVQRQPPDLGQTERPVQPARRQPDTMPSCTSTFMRLAPVGEQVGVVGAAAPKTLTTRASAVLGAGAHVQRLDGQPDGRVDLDHRRISRVQAASPPLLLVGQVMRNASGPRCNSTQTSVGAAVGAQGAVAAGSGSSMNSACWAQRRVRAFTGLRASGARRWR